MVIVGKDGFGFTSCGSNHPRIASFAEQAQARIDPHLDQGGAFEFFIEGRASVYDGQMLIKGVTVSTTTHANASATRGDGHPGLGQFVQPSSLSR